MTNCRHLILFLVVQKISMIEMDHSLHCYHWMHFTKRLWEKVPTTTRHTCKYYCSFTQPDQFFFFFQKEPRQFLFIWYGHATTKRVSHKVDETECRWAKCAPWEGQVQAVHPCERCCPTSLSCRLPLSVQKQNFSSVIAASGFLWQKIAL